VGTSFQAPTFNQLYFPGFGTPSLTPQTNKSSELGLKYNKGNVSWSAIAYNNEIQGFIVPSTNVQSSMAVLNGATLSAQIAQGNTTYAVSYDYADPHAYTTTARAKDLRFVRVAQHIVQLRANHRLQEVSVFGEFKYSSSREDAKVVGTGRDTLPEYTLLNLGAQWHFRKNWSTLARLNNATDTKYMLANGFSMPGANLFVSLNWTQ
jgi:vitamin B12 transporter